jgi:rhodanese-related sulfurtransferase
MSYIGIIAGGVAGFLYWKFIGCASGTCPITSNKYISVIYGALLGSLLLSTIAGSATKPGFMNRIFAGDSSKTCININAEEMSSMLSDTEFVIIDVRTPDEWSTGYITGTDKFIDINTGNFEDQLESLDKSKKYIVYCRSGNRSSKACSIMSRNGFTNLYNLSGGINKWNGEIKKD